MNPQKSSLNTFTCEEIIYARYKFFSIDFVTLNKTKYMFVFFLLNCQDIKNRKNDLILVTYHTRTDVSPVCF